MIRAQDVHQEIKAAIHLVLVVGNVRQRVGGIAAGLHQHPVLLVTKARAAEEGCFFRALGQGRRAFDFVCAFPHRRIINLPLGTQRVQRLPDRIALVKAVLVEEHVMLNAQPQ